MPMTEQTGRPNLFDPATEQIVLNALRIKVALLMIGAGALAIVVNVWMFWPPAPLIVLVPGAVVLAVTAGLLIFMRVRPTVLCRACRSGGWIADLEKSDGLCPRCGGTRFDYVDQFGIGRFGVLALSDVEGQALLGLSRKNRAYR